MRISDWSSDVCSSDLLGGLARRHVGEIADHPRGGVHRVHAVGGEGGVRFLAAHVAADRGLALVAGDDLHLGRLADHAHGRAHRLAREELQEVWHALRSEEHTSELQSLMRISYAVFCLKKKKQ